MMKFRSFRYYLKEAITNLFRNGVMSTVSVLTVASCIFMFVLMFSLAVNIDFMLHQLSNTLGFVVVISDDATTAEKEALYAQIIDAPHVSDLRYIPADEGLRNFMESLGADDGLFEGLGLHGSNPLPHIFEVRVGDPRYMEMVVRNIVAIGGETVDEINEQSELVNGLITFNRGVRIASVAVVAVFVSISVIIIINTIKLTVNNRKTEIGIMKYVGATDWFVRWPFIIEGILIGIIGALAADIIFSYSYTAFINSDFRFFEILGEFAAFRPSSEMLPLVSIVALPTGVAIGAVASLLSVRKYLKV
ncbi:MAG: permease-like cell division protein FtsX [Defluviitaleaceae bacterium]|nr:permease-like cell division protein FtsX [Defluviitaleaceae bacterium]